MPRRGITSQEEGSPAYFYVANRGNNEGYALVAADDRIPTILAYSPIGRFDMNSMPDNLRMWLQVYDQEIGLILPEKLGSMKRYYAPRAYRLKYML